MGSILLVSIVDLHKTYKHKKALAGVTLDFARDTIYALIGPNGAGKTTLVSILAGLLTADKVSIKNDEKLSCYLVLAGDRSLYPVNTVEENILYFATIQGLSKADIKRNIKTYATYLPMYYDLSKTQVQKLSLGQKRLMTIFSALVCDSNIIIIDEVSEGLDFANKENLAKVLQQIKPGKIIILCSHDFDFVSVCADNLIFLNGGKVHNQFSLVNDGSDVVLLKEQYRLMVGDIDEHPPSH
jgi:ABC-2 type transport system ATP-binding protein